MPSIQKEIAPACRFLIVFSECKRAKRVRIAQIFYVGPLSLILIQSYVFGFSVLILCPDQIYISFVNMTNANKRGSYAITITKEM